MTRAVSIRPLRTSEIEPHIPLLIENGFTPEIDQGVWLGGFIDGDLTGWIRVFELDGEWMLEDVFVLEHHRHRGIATALLHEGTRDRDHLWLICDDEMVSFYETHGYRLMPKDAFPEPLATLYQGKREWPTGLDHNHNAMLWTRQ